MLCWSKQILFILFLILVSCSVASSVSFDMSRFLLSGEIDMVELLLNFYPLLYIYRTKFGCNLNFYFIKFFDDIFTSTQRPA